MGRFKFTLRRVVPCSVVGQPGMNEERKEKHVYRRDV